MKTIKYLNKAKLVLIDNKKYIIKPRKRDIEEIYQKLQNRGFKNFIEPVEINETSEIYPYVDELAYSNFDKAQDIIYLTSLLHNQTTYFEKIDIDEIKYRYEQTVEKIDQSYHYYTNLQEIIEEKIYMSPAEQLLMNNISKIYLMCNVSRDYIEKYYKNIEKETNERKVINHGNLSLDHIIESDNKYLISWHEANRNLPVMDLVTFYQKEYNNIEIESLFDLYQSKYSYNEIEKELFFSLINIPNIIELNKTNYFNTLEVRNFVDYIDKTLEFTLKQNKEN